VLLSSMSLLARLVKSKADLQLQLEVIDVLHGVNGCQFQLSSTQLTALAAASHHAQLTSAQQQVDVAKASASGCRQHLGAMLQIVFPASSLQRDHQLQRAIDALPGVSGYQFRLSSTQLTAQVAVDS